MMLRIVFLKFLAIDIYTYARYLGQQLYFVRSK
jgi:hypothetical protein